MSDINQDILLGSAKEYLKNSGISYIVRSSSLIQEKEEVLLKEIDTLREASTVTENLELDAVREIALSCTNCRLCESRTNVVFGSGEIQSPVIAFIGEGPGAEEDFHGEPFVGKAGEFLTSAIVKGMKLSRDQVYITNVVKCRPPDNRTPQADEIASCKPYLEKQLELIKPQSIVLLGETAQRALIGSDEGITKLRGKWLEWRGIPVMPTVHPVYVLKNPSAKRDFWEDLKMVMEKLGIEG